MASRSSSKSTGPAPCFTVQEALDTNSISLGPQFELDFILRIFEDADKFVTLGPWQEDAVEATLSYVERRAYKLSRNFPEYVPMEWIVKRAYLSVPHLEFKLIDDPSLLLPDNPALVPRASRHDGGVVADAPGPGGHCARQFGRVLALEEFAKDVQLNNVSITACAALSKITPVSGRMYDVDDLFPVDHFPGEVIGMCCAHHNTAIKKKRLSTVDAFVKKSCKRRVEKSLAEAAAAKSIMQPAPMSSTAAIEVRPAPGSSLASSSPTPSSGEAVATVQGGGSSSAPSSSASSGAASVRQHTLDTFVTTKPRPCKDPVRTYSSSFILWTGKAQKLDAYFVRRSDTLF